MQSLTILIDVLVDVFLYMIFISVILSWLVQFNVVNPRHPFVSGIARFLRQILEPALRPIRKYVPLIGGIDVSPFILALLVWFGRNLLFEYVL
jgi:YggT family protein